MKKNWILSSVILVLDKNDPAAAQKHFKIQITKIGLLEKKELNEEFFNQLYPDQEVKTEADFRNKIKEEIRLTGTARSRTRSTTRYFINWLIIQILNFLKDF